MTVNQILHADPVVRFVALAEGLRLLDRRSQRLGLFILTTPIAPMFLTWAYVCSDADARTVRYATGDHRGVVEVPLSRAARALVGDAAGPIVELLGAGAGGIEVALAELNNALRDLDHGAEVTVLDLFAAGVCADATLAAAGRREGASDLGDLLSRAGLGN